MGRTIGARSSRFLWNYNGPPPGLRAQKSIQGCRPWLRGVPGWS
ncbi:MAG TPA: hypothetical protein VFZ99_04280 [Terriglobales bacterium]